MAKRLFVKILSNCLECPAYECHYRNEDDPFVSTDFSIKYHYCSFHKKSIDSLGKDNFPIFCKLEKYKKDKK